MKILLLLVVAVVAYGQISPPPSTPPSGSAGGNLSGSYPNPTVAKINGSTVTTNAAANQVLLTTSSAVTAWTSLPSCQDTVGQHLNFNTTTHAFSCGTTAITPTAFTDFPDKKYIPSANCSASTAGAGWSTPTSSAPTISCHTGSNIQDGYLQYADAQSAQFSILIPADWDSAASLDARLFFTDASTSGTVIWQAATSCTAVGGTQTDDQAFNTAQSFGTVTLGATASAGWIATLTGMTKTGCTAGTFLHVKIIRTTDTAVGVANASGVELTMRRTF